MVTRPLGEAGAESLYRWPDQNRPDLDQLCSTRVLPTIGGGDRLPFGSRSDFCSSRFSGWGCTLRWQFLL